VHYSEGIEEYPGNLVLKTIINEIFDNTSRSYVASHSANISETVDKTSSKSECKDDKEVVRNKCQHNTLNNYSVFL
jgi:hypothetical protein